MYPQRFLPNARPATKKARPALFFRRPQFSTDSERQPLRKQSNTLITVNGRPLSNLGQIWNFKFKLTVLSEKSAPEMLAERLL